jgi:hypothetical protein
VSDDLLTGLREELVSAAWRARQRRRRRRVLLTSAGAAAAVLVAVVLTLAAGSDEPVAAGVEVEVVDGRITVEVTAVETRPEVVEAALRDVGLDATVTAHPVGPSNTGRFLIGASNLPGGVEINGASGGAFAAFSAPAGMESHLELALGRPARGQRYVLASDAYAPGEPLSCSGLYGEPVAALIAFAEDHPELDITVQIGASGSTTPLDEADTELRVSDAVSPAAGAVTVILTPDGESPFVEPLSPDRGACRE